MSAQVPRPIRQVGIADHLWDALALMSSEMGVEREGLINQALFAFARQNGYLLPGQTARAIAAPVAVEEPKAVLAAPVIAAPVIPQPVLAQPVIPQAVIPQPVIAAPVAQPFATPAPAPVVAAPAPVGVPTPAFVAPAAPAPNPFAAPLPGQPRLALDEATPPTGTPAVQVAQPAPAPAPAPVARFDSLASVNLDEEPPVGSTVAIRARPAASVPPPAAQPAPVAPVYVTPPPPTPAAFAAPAPTPFGGTSNAFGQSAPSAPDLGTKMSPDEVRAAQERVLQKAAELERLVRGGGAGEESDDGVDDGLLGGSAANHMDEGTPAPAAQPKSGVLVLFAEGREVDRVTGPRFLIGRGKHCDLIINSGKVSREHAAIVHEGELYFIEDLGSSNGTWFDKKRITRRKVEDGDEYFVCSEKITCRLM